MSDEAPPPAPVASPGRRDRGPCHCRRLARDLAHSGLEAMAAQIMEVHEADSGHAWIGSVPPEMAGADDL